VSAPETCKCATCGYEWRRGLSGDHRCVVMLRAEIERRQDRHEIRRNDDGTLDEVVGFGAFQLEQMCSSHWFLSLGPVHVHLTTSRGSIKAMVEVDEPHTRSVRDSGTENAADLVGRHWSETAEIDVLRDYCRHAETHQRAQAEELERLRADDKRNRAMLFTLNDAVERLRADAAIAAAFRKMKETSFAQQGEALSVIRGIESYAAIAAATPNTKDKT
jgi:hypothetical protein